MNNDLGGALPPSVIEFVQAHVRSLLSWDIIMFLVRNPDAVLDIEGLAERLGRREEEIETEVAGLAGSGLLISHGGLVRLSGSEPMRQAAQEFAYACEDRSERLSLIAIVLKRLSEEALG